MEVMLRCELPDRPGALARLAGTIGEAGGDIHAVEVIETSQGAALDDLVVVLEPSVLSTLVERIRGLEGVRLIHAGPSRGHPGDAVTRVAVGLESLLNGAMTLEHGIRTLVGGLLRASSASLEDPGDAPRDGGTVLVLPAGERRLVLRRDYRFTPAERHRAEALLRVAIEATHARRQHAADAG